MGYAIVFSGQGDQHAGMLRWLAHDDRVRAVEREVGVDWRRQLADADGSADNRRAQLLLTGLSLAAWGQLAPQLPPPSIVCGYSVGELAAFAAAGVFDHATALSLAARRAECMDAAAAAAAETGLIGVSGFSGFSDAEPGLLGALCERFDLDVAIRIDAGRVVLGGLRSTLAQAAAVAAGQGLRCTPLNIALASHTRWMKSAASAFEQVLARTPLQQPTLPLASNALGLVRSAAQAGDALARQIAQTVAWDDCTAAIESRHVDAVLEIGPGQALARMWQQRRPDVPARSVDEFVSATAIQAWLLRQLARD